jgi:uncharacterized FlaG/YvyC family protein
VQTQQTTAVGNQAFDRLPPLERTAAHPAESTTARARAHAGRDAAEFTVAIQDAAAGASFDVRYGLDPVTNVWVASFFDAATGELVKSVPATRVMHQLAELRAVYERGVDRRA